MPNYRRRRVAGGTYFFTIVTYRRYPWLCSDIGRSSLRLAIQKVQQKYPFYIDAFVLLLDHFHCLWTLPVGDTDYSNRLRLIKTYVTKNSGKQLAIASPMTASRYNRQESNLWQRRFWEHTIRDREDFDRHCDYIHYNPVKHGLCQFPQQWQFSSIHRFIAQDIYPKDWGSNPIPDIPIERGYE